MLKDGGRKKPMSVWLLSRANSTARLEGADTAATIGIPAASAFCMISNDARPLTRRRCRLQWQQPVEKRASDCLIDCVVAPDILARNFQFAVHAENSGGMNSACAREIALRVAQCPGERQQRFNINPDIS